MNEYNINESFGEKIKIDSDFKSDFPENSQSYLFDEALYLLMKESHSPKSRSAVDIYKRVLELLEKEYKYHEKCALFKHASSVLSQLRKKNYEQSKKA